MFCCTRFALQKHEDDLLSFNEFVSGVRVCLLFEEFLTKSEELFRALDPGALQIVLFFKLQMHHSEGSGAIRSSSLIEALKVFHSNRSHTGKECLDRG